MPPNKQINALFTEHKHLTTKPYHSELTASHLYTQHMQKSQAFPLLNQLELNLHFALLNMAPDRLDGFLITIESPDLH